MKDIYVFFIATEFKTGKAIRFLTRGKYNHVAFSFAPSTENMYSYSRYRYHEPFLSGFGIEYTDRYRSDEGSVDIKVCKVQISDEHYERIQSKLERYSNAKRTRYNFIDLLVYPFNIHVNLEYTHTCISFLLDILESKNIHTIGQLERNLNQCVIYEGAMDKFEKCYTRGPIDFFEKRGRIKVYRESGMVLCGLAAAFVGTCFKKVMA